MKKENLVQCSLCGVSKRKLVQHHVTYQPEWTVPLCGRCHLSIHRPQFVLQRLVRVLREYADRYGTIPVAPRQHRAAIRLEVRAYLEEISDLVTDTVEGYPNNSPVTVQKHSAKR